MKMTCLILPTVQTQTLVVSCIFCLFYSKGTSVRIYHLIVVWIYPRIYRKQVVNSCRSSLFYFFKACHTLLQTKFKIENANI